MRQTIDLTKVRTVALSIPMRDYEPENRDQYVAIQNVIHPHEGL